MQKRRKAVEKKTREVPVLIAAESVEETPPAAEPVVESDPLHITAADIRAKTVIQLHHLIRTEYPQCSNLLDLYSRDGVQEKLIEMLGLE